MTEARTITHCRACDSVKLAPVLDLGEHRLSDFREGPSRPPVYPLRLVLCEACTLLQLAETAPRAELYHERYGFKSGVSEVIRNDLHDVVDTAREEFLFLNQRAPKTWLDIASNDGTLLSYVDKNAFRVGVDPLAQFADEARQHADEICVEFFDPTTFGSQKFDVVTSVSMFYDLDDINAFVAGVGSVLTADGVWVIQQNYAADMLRNTVFDNVCHEHVTYFALSSLGPLLYRHGLIVTDVLYSPVNGGCIRTVVTHRGRPGGPALRETIGDCLFAESGLGIGSVPAWSEFAARTDERLEQLQLFVHDKREAGDHIAIYGASTRGATIWQAAGLGPKHFRYAVERQPAKVGKYMSAIGVPIVSEESFRAEMADLGQPAVAVVGPWFFRDAIVERESRAGGYLDHGGRLAFPLPELQVVGRYGKVLS